jgi:hypothetical protein
LTTLHTHLEVAAQGCLSCRGSQTDKHLRVDDVNFFFEPREACRNFSCARLLVDSALSLGNPLEVFDHIGHVSLCSTDAGRLKSFVEHSSSRAHERLTLEIFIVSRLLSHQQCSRGTPAFTKNGLGGIFEQRATLTASGRFSERVDGDFGN